MTKRSIAIALALLLAALALPMAPSPVMANPGSQYWYLTDFTSGVTGADYRMIRGSGNGGTDTLMIDTLTSKVWVAAVDNATDEASNIYCRMSGTWSVMLWADGEGNSDSSLTVDIGVLSGGSFTSKGTSAEQTVAKAGGTLDFNVTTTDLNLNPGEYLAVRVNCTSGNKYFDLDVLGATNSPCFVTSPIAADDYPGTVTISFTVTDYGSAGINFSSVDPGTSNNAEADQGATFDDGSHTGADSSTVLIDSSATFQATGVAPGMTVVNTTDGSSGTVSTVDSETQLTLASALTGGSDNTFQSGDSYAIKSGAVKLTVGAETNVNCSIETKGDALAITIASGTADSGSSTTLVDADGDFVNNGVAVDDIVINRTDSSTATITAVTATQLTFSGGLSGGSDNTFAEGDAYSVREATPAYTIDIGQAKWDTDSDVTGATAMTGTYAQITTSIAGSLTEQDVWHWLSVPSGQVAGDYTGMFYYQAIQQ